jgi:hypothetical protein
MQCAYYPLEGVKDGAPAPYLKHLLTFFLILSWYNYRWNQVAIGSLPSRSHFV